MGSDWGCVIPSAQNHLNFAALVLLLLVLDIDISNNSDKVVFVICVLAGSLAPDIDHPSGTLSKIAPLHWLGRMSKAFKHGGITHTIIVNLILFGLWYYYKSIIYLGIGVGWATHLYIDNLDGNKLKYLYYPFRRRKHDKQRKD